MFTWTAERKCCCVPRRKPSNEQTGATIQTETASQFNWDAVSFFAIDSDNHKFSKVRWRLALWDSNSLLTILADLQAANDAVC
jgi:hypothetical protein